jgi:hypothetical protein
MVDGTGSGQGAVQDPGAGEGPDAAARPSPTAPEEPSPAAPRRAPPPLEPLAPGERPWPIAVSAVVAFALGALTLTLFLAGAKVAGTKPSAASVVVYTGLMFGLGVGVWRRRYWAVLGFEALLAVGVIGFSLAAIRVTSTAWFVISLIVIVASGFLFFKLARIIGRIQAGTRGTE